MARPGLPPTLRWRGDAAAGHLELLASAAVYRQIRDWLAPAR